MIFLVLCAVCLFTTSVIHHSRELIKTVQHDRYIRFRSVVRVQVRRKRGWGFILCRDLRVAYTRGQHHDAWYASFCCCARRAVTQLIMSSAARSMHVKCVFVFVFRVRWCLALLERVSRVFCVSASVCLLTGENILSPPAATRTTMPECLLGVAFAPCVRANNTIRASSSRLVCHAQRQNARVHNSSQKPTHSAHKHSTPTHGMVEFIPHESRQQRAMRSGR